MSKTALPCTGAHVLGRGRMSSACGETSASRGLGHKQFPSHSHAVVDVTACGVGPTKLIFSW